MSPVGDGSGVGRIEFGPTPKTKDEVFAAHKMPAFESQAVMGDRVIDMHTGALVGRLNALFVARAEVRAVRRDLLIGARLFRHRAHEQPGSGFTLIGAAIANRAAARRLREMSR